MHNSRKRLHKGTSEAPVLSSSERDRRSKEISLWGEGKRKRFPLYSFCWRIMVLYNPVIPMRFIGLKCYKDKIFSISRQAPLTKTGRRPAAEPNIRTVGPFRRTRGIPTGCLRQSRRKAVSPNRRFHLYFPVFQLHLNDFIPTASHRHLLLHPTFRIFGCVLDTPSRQCSNKI